MKAEIKTRDGGITVQGNFVDQVVNYLDPARGNKRMQARLMAAIAGGYYGGSRVRRSLKAWNPFGTDPDGAILFDLPALRERSRDLVRNAPLAGGAINTVCTSVVGTGLKLRSRIDREILKMDEAAADAWERQTEREWRLWAKTAECDVARTLDFAAIQDLVFRQVLENGDVFILMPSILRTGQPYGMRLQVVEGDRICNKDNAKDTRTLAGGVERDENGAPVAYHIMDQHPGALIGPIRRSWTVVQAFGNRTGRRNVLHLYKVLRPGQTRGVPYLAPVIESLKGLDRYTEAEITAAVISGMFTVFVKSATGSVGLSPMAPTSEVGGAEADEDFKLASGAILNLAQGEEIQTANPGRPNAAFDPFVMSVLRQIGVALELPFEILVKHFTASYSAARAAILEAWRFFKARRTWLAANFCQAVYENLMDEAVALGRIKAPGYFGDPIIRKAYLGSKWIGDAPGQIDELKEINASKLRIEEGISTLDDETAAITGGDFERNIVQIKKERKLLKDAGLLQEKENTEGKEGRPMIEEMPPEEEDQPERGEAR
ncbi:MAG: phage portal protein [Deltaproteobacteria bacterium]|nr:phage portal protein [Deltaproteobacteria bacterium]